jgi:prepilin-type N-terminal cleavage/methylation domain-containing protein
VTARRVSENGFTLVEMLIASAVMLTITAATFALVHPTQGIFKAQPEMADMQQRLRVGVDTIAKDLLMAGAGTGGGPGPGALFRYLPPVMPYRMGDRDSDPSANVYYRSDTITVFYVPVTTAQAIVRQALSANATDIEVDTPPNCPPNTPNRLCGFERGMRVLVFDVSGRWDAFNVTDVQPAARHLQFAPGTNVAYAPGVPITQVASHTYYLKTNAATDTYQLMHYDGEQTDLPLIDNVVALEFRYFGEPQPPALLEDLSLPDAVGPFTTYGPKPPPIGVDDPADSWAVGENCVFTVVNGTHVPRLPALAAGNSQVSLPAGVLTDGPWCPDDSHPHRFDADLLRIRRISVTLRVQVALGSLRGPAGVLFAHGGTATSARRYVPDMEVTFDIAPRNMNLGR